MDDLPENSQSREFEPIWELDEEKISNARTFSDFKEANEYSIKNNLSEYKVIDASGKDKVVKAESAHEALNSSGIKDPVTIIFLEPGIKTFLSKEDIEASKK